MFPITCQDRQVSRCLSKKIFSSVYKIDSTGTFQTEMLKLSACVRFNKEHSIRSVTKRYLVGFVFGFVLLKSRHTDPYLTWPCLCFHPGVCDRKKKTMTRAKDFLFNALPKLCSLYLSTASVKIFASTYTFSWLEANKQQEVMMTEQQRKRTEGKEIKKDSKVSGRTRYQSKEDGAEDMGELCRFLAFVGGFVCIQIIIIIK
jgi:hypothetical protein